MSTAEPDPGAEPVTAAGSRGPHAIRNRWLAGLVALLVVGSAALVAVRTFSSEPERASTAEALPAAATDAAATDAAALPAGTWPSTPPAQICSDTRMLAGPASPPQGALVVPAGSNEKLTASYEQPSFGQAGRTFWFAPGVHTLGNNLYSQIIPGDGTTFIGAPGAIIDGQRKNGFAFTQGAKNVTIKFLTIRHFGTGDSNNDEGVVNHDRGPGWVISHNLITENDGSGVQLGPRSTTTDNCLKNNGQYGFSAVPPQGAESEAGITLSHNEIVGNNADDWEKLRPGCGCTGGGKFWSVNGATVTGNYVHDNRGAGFWADYNNRGMAFVGNWIEGNDNEGIIYEISYNFSIRDNVLIKNALVHGRALAKSGDHFPAGAIYVSESGGDTRAGAKYAQSDITNNLLRDNWDGVVLWENADRFCRPATENSDTSATCPWFSKQRGTRYRTQNITISGNDFQFDPAQVGCTNQLCGRNAMFSNYGTQPKDSPYKGTVVEQAITFGQHNVWARNNYRGPWHFMPWDVATDKTFAQWQAKPYGQDASSAAASG